MWLWLLVELNLSTCSKVVGCHPYIYLGHQYDWNVSLLNVYADADIDIVHWMFHDEDFSSKETWFGNDNQECMLREQC